jgi:diaminohydroxyphosphoribosylaminopyrimidine deaminase/5-amino-6-(5-phosphoribosylamino)uracil reductase
MQLIPEDTATLAGLREPVPGTRAERMMLRAIRLAEKGRGRTSPNPMVGAVIVRGDEVIGEGYHDHAGGPHAEVVALGQAGDRAAGAVMYVTLEPCSHHGRTPPCVDSLIEVGVAEVVMALRDPNPLVDGRGVGLLEEHMVKATPGPYGEIAARQNECYLKWIVTGLPFVTLKMALSIDGKVATRTGESKWISSEASRSDVQRMRAASDAVMVGIGTVVKDNPRLTLRDVEGTRTPLRVIVDSLARTPVESNVARTDEAPTMVAAAAAAPEDSVRALERRGVEVVRLDKRGKVDLFALLALLGERGVTALQVEGGPELTRGLWEEGLVDKLVFYFAPKVIAGCEAPGPVGGAGVACVEESSALSIAAVQVVGPDIKVTAYPERR